MTKRAYNFTAEEMTMIRIALNERARKVDNGERYRTLAVAFEGDTATLETVTT